MFDRPYFQEDWNPLDIEKCVRRFYRSWDSARYRDCLSRFGIASGKKVKSLSRGMTQKLTLAVHLSHDARMLLLDEPASDLERIADCIVYISHGAASCCGDKEELKSSCCVVQGGRLPEEKKAYLTLLKRSVIVKGRYARSLVLCAGGILLGAV